MSQKPFNPFEHHHDHGHGHDHDHGHGHDHDHGPGVEELDPAQQALADALRVTFLLLKVGMVVAIAAYFFTGLFWVQPQTAAIRLRFGKIVGDSAQEKVILSGGAHYYIPYPIEQLIRIPTGPRQIDLIKEFFYEVRPEDIGKTEDQLAANAIRGPLNPEKVGSLLVADGNIMHARLTVEYRIGLGPTGAVEPAAVLDFVNHIAEAASDDRVIANSADQIVQVAAEQALIEVAANTTTDQMSASGNALSAAAIREATQAALDRMHTGIRITNVRAPLSFPLNVMPAVQKATQADNQRAQRIETARQNERKTLNGAAGEAYTDLIALLDEYEVASLRDDRPRLKELDGQLDQAFYALRMPSDRGSRAITGEVAGVMNQALADKQKIIKEVEAEALAFDPHAFGIDKPGLLQQYRQSPGIFVTRQWLDTLESILGDADATFHMTSEGGLIIELNRNPDQRPRTEFKNPGDVRPTAVGQESPSR